MNVVAVLLSAGESERRGSPKALLPWHGQPLLSHQIQQIQKSRLDECVVVLGEEAARLAPMVERPPLRPGWKARAVRNPRARDGKCTSIHAGLAAMTVAPAGILIASVDQPLDWRLLNAMLRAAGEEWDRAQGAGRRRVIVPSLHGPPRHSPLVPSSPISQ